MLTPRPPCPPASYEYKVARNEAWDQSHPANNVPFTLAADGAVTFRYNCATNEVRDSINNPDTGTDHRRQQRLL